MKKLLAVLFALVVILALALFVGPSFVDWNAYRGDIEAELEAATGREVKIAGDVRLSIVPKTEFSVGQVSLANIDGASHPQMLSLAALRLSVQPLALLEGRAQVDRVELVSPTIRLERLADGRANWDLEALGAGEPAAKAPAGGGGGGLITDVTFERVVISEGTVTYRDATSGTEQKIENVSLAISAESLRGPFAAEGSLDLAGQAVELEVETGRLIAGTASRVTGFVALPRRGVEAEVAGALSLEEGGPGFSGELTLTADSLDSLAALGGQGEASLPLGTRSLTLKAALTADAEQLAADDLRIDLGDLRVTGSAHWLGAANALDLELSLPHLNADKLLAELPEGDAGSSGSEGVPAAPSATQRFAFSLPADLNMTAQLGVDALTYREQVIRQVRLGGTLVESRLSIDQARALLPGGSEVSLSGSLETPEATPRFDLAMEASADNLRAVLDWLGADVSDVPAGRLRRASFAGRMAGTPNQFQLTNLDLQLDVSRITGGVAVAWYDRLGLGIGLSVDQINLDAYLPESGSDGGSGGGEGAGAPALSLAPLSGIDANFDLRAQSFSFAGKTAEGVHLDGTLDKGDITLRRAFVSSLAGVQAEVSGDIAQAEAGPRVDLDLALDILQPERFAQSLGQDPTIAGRLGPASITGALAGDVERLTLDANMASGHGNYAIAGTLDPLASPLAFDLSVNADVPNAAELMRRLGQAEMADMPLGALALESKLRGTAAALEIADLNATLGQLSLSGGGSADLGGEAGALSLNASLAHPDAALMIRQFAINEPVLRNPGPFAADLALAGTMEALRIERFDMTMGDLTAAVSGSLSPGDEPLAFDLALTASHPEGLALARVFELKEVPAAAEGGVALEAGLQGTSQSFALKPLDLAIGKITAKGEASIAMRDPRPYVEADLALGEVPFAALSGGGGDRGGTASGDGPRWSEEPIELAGLDALDVRFDLSVEKLIMDQGTVENLALIAIIEDRRLTIEDLTGRLYGGDIIARAMVQQRSPVRLSLDFEGRGIDSAAFGKQAADFERLSGPVDLILSVTGEGESEAAIVRSLTGDGSLDGEITLKAKGQEQAGNVALQLLGSQLTQIRGITDAVGVLFAGFAGKPARLTGPFVIENGVVVSENTRLEGPDVRALVDYRADLPSWVLDAEGRVYRPEDPPETPYLRVTAKGPLDEPNYGIGGRPFSREGGTPQPQDIIKGLIPGLGGKSEEAPAGEEPAAEDGGKSTSPQDVIKGLLGGGDKAPSRTQTQTDQEPVKAPASEEQPVVLPEPKPEPPEEGPSEEGAVQIQPDDSGDAGTVESGGGTIEPVPEEETQPVKPKRDRKKDVIEGILNQLKGSN